jgi:hypothetical protein
MGYRFYPLETHRAVCNHFSQNSLIHTCWDGRPTQSSRSKAKNRNYGSPICIHHPVTREGVCVRVKNNDVSADPKPASTPALIRLLSDYHAATEQYGVIVGYLKAAIEVLPKAECQLLLEFAEIALHE